MANIDEDFRQRENMRALKRIDEQINQIEFSSSFAGVYKFIDDNWVHNFPLRPYFLLILA